MLPQFTKLADLLPKAMNKFNVAAPLRGAQVVNRWQEIARTILGVDDPGMALFLKDGVLTVGAHNTSLAQTIQMRKPELIKALNDSLGVSRVTDIRCRQE